MNHYRLESYDSKTPVAVIRQFPVTVKSVPIAASRNGLEQSFAGDVGYRQRTLATHALLSSAGRLLCSKS